MAINRIKSRDAYGIGGPLLQMSALPVVAQRAPKTSDIAEIGTMWVDQPTNDIYIITSITANVANWENTGGGDETPNSLASTTFVTAGSYITAGTALTVTAMAAHGVLTNTAAGLFVTNPLTDGQLLVGSTGLAPVATTLTAGVGVAITEGVGTISIAATGATAVQYTADDANILLPDGVGNVNVLGLVGGNIVTSGATANTISINTIAAPEFTGLVTCAAGLQMATGTFTIISDTNAINAVGITANGGVNEAITITSALGTSAAAINIAATVGGVSVTSGLAGAASVALTAGNAAGGITATTGTGGFTVTSANGAINLTSGTADINVGVDATVHDIVIGSVTGASTTTVQSGTGNLALTSTGTTDIDSTDAVSINSTGGAINVGDDADTQNINVGTGASARVITIGNATLTTSLVLNAGTGNVQIGANATDHATTLGSITAGSATTVRAGTDPMTFTAGGIFDVNATGAVTVDTAASISLDSATASNFTVTGAGTDLTLASVGGSVAITSTEDAANAVSINANGGTAETVTISSTQGTGIDSVNLASTAGGISLVAALAAAGAITINASDAAGGIDVDCGTGGFALDVANGPIAIVSGTGQVDVSADATATTINVGTGAGVKDVALGSVNTTSSTTINSGTGGVIVTSGGLMAIAAATDTQATPTAASTLNVNAGIATFTGFTTASAGTQAFTITNALVADTSGVLVSVSNLGANDARMNVERVTPAAGSFVVDLINSGTQACNGNILVTFWILN